MAKKTLEVLLDSNYGKRGELISMEVPKDGLSARQSVMLREYKEKAVRDVKDIEPNKA